MYHPLYNREMSNANDGVVRVERDGAIATLVLERPDRHNALNEAMWSSLEEAVTGLEAAPPRAVVLTGAGERAFSAGMDVNPDNPQVSGLVDAVTRGDRAPVERTLARIRSIADRLALLPVPVVAALNGLAYGAGAEIAVRCDLRVVDPRAVICFSEVRLGLMPDVGGGVALARLVGPGRAADLILTGRKVGADEALSLGVVSRVSAPGRALHEAQSLARTIAANGPRAVRAALDVIRRAADLPEREALALELSHAAGLVASGECAVGISAFLQRMDPVFADP
jgi:enoyl-CoA hydratase